MVGNEGCDCWETEMIVAVLGEDEKVELLMHNQRILFPRP